jgi:UPF0148 protein
LDEDQKLQKITRLLEQGCTMLAEHHDCGAPFFRCKGDVVCPVCSFEEDAPLSAIRTQPPDPARSESVDERARRLQEATREPSSDADVPKVDAIDMHKDEGWDRARDHLHRSMLGKLQAIVAAMQEEQDLDKLKRQLDCIEGLIRALKSLQG